LALLLLLVLPQVLLMLVAVVDPLELLEPLALSARRSFVSTSGI